MGNIKLNVKEPGEIFTPYWKKLTTAGRAAEGLREDWRQHLREVQKEIGFEYIRYHGIFCDDMMIYNEREDGTPIYNWQYFDYLFDFLLSIGLRPMLELSFTPSAMASGSQTCFWWKGNVTPPKDYKKWAGLIDATVRHCINRYGMTEVLKWYFEVWNEPNLKYFWGGTQEQYFELYRVTAEAIKSVDPRLKVGGPSSCGFINKKAPWLEEFLDYCEKNHLPVDFIAAHPYPNDSPLDATGKSVMTLDGPERTFNDIQWIRNTLKKSVYTDAEMHLTEWSSSPSPRDLIHDTAFEAPFVIQNNLKCIGLTDSLGWWAFSDVFEETAAGESPFHGGFGLINLQGLKKASFYGYWFLNRLGSEKLARGDNYFVTRKDDKIQILLWNYCHYTDALGGGDRSTLTLHDRYSIFKEKEESFSLTVDGLDGDYKVITYSFGKECGSVFDAWVNNSAPESPTMEEVEILKKKTGPEASIKVMHGLKSFNEEFKLPAHQVVLLELQKLI